jgi:hypothetical protein
MKWPAKPPGKLLPNNAQDGLKANIGDVGEFVRDFDNVAQAGKIARSDSEHFPLFEAAQFGQSAGVIVLSQSRLKQTVNLTAKTMRTARKLKSLEVELWQPIRMCEKQIAERLRAAEQRNERAD